MGAHRPGQVPVGAFVDVELRNYLDKLVEERGLLTRSDAVRLVLSEHKAVFSKRICGKEALSPLDVETGPNYHNSKRSVKI